MKAQPSTGKTAARTAPSIRQVLVPVDFSEPSIDALRFAAGFAETFGATLTVLHVVEPFHVDWKMDTLTLRRRARSEALRHLQKLVADEIHGARPGQAKLDEGHPAQSIVDFARRSKTDLIVMGTHGRSGVTRALIGSVAERVVRHAHCPVMVVRTARK